MGTAMAALNPQCRYGKCIFVIAHMRCGSTALSNILCSRPDVSGYGEAHIRYDGGGALGRLAVNQAKRQSWKPRATHLFDKILHSRHDGAACDGFFTARAIFVAREPFAAIRSIRKLYDGLGRDEYTTDTAAAEYYIERMETLLRHWDRFPADNRVGLTHAALLAAPEAELERISTVLRISPPLENRYESRAASRKGGAGDPTASGKFTRIEPRPGGGFAEDGADLALSPDLRSAAQDVYQRFRRTIGEPHA
ncbi:Sulfotransferase family protein [Salipiger abyssi]|uniref:Sulfotransferase family protein n=2 Tax=Salipiger abyssi TaxID=1250539 RepID=A0A1P8UTZ7_9RHOB|nr:Sulfotransferase family protein [Salipiger abyssi]